MDYSIWWIIIPSFSGLLYIFINSQIGARKELKLREKGYKPKNYQDKMPHEYTPKQKEHTLIIIAFLFTVSVFALYFYLNRQTLIANFLLVFGILGWKKLIKMGNSMK